MYNRNVVTQGHVGLQGSLGNAVLNLAVKNGERGLGVFSVQPTTLLPSVSPSPGRHPWLHLADVYPLF